MSSKEKYASPPNNNYKSNPISKGIQKDDRKLQRDGCHANPNECHIDKVCDRDPETQEVVRDKMSEPS